MGFFDKFIKKGIGKSINKTICDDTSKTVEPVTPEFANKTEEKVDVDIQSIQSSQTHLATPFEQKIYDTDDNYFASLITEANFPGYSISANIHAQSFDSSAHPSCYPISYLFSNGSRPVLAVLIMNKNQYRSMIAKGTYKVLDDNGIPYIRFFKGMENESGYVIDRIKNNLR